MKKFKKKKRNISDRKTVLNFKVKIFKINFPIFLLFTYLSPLISQLSTLRIFTIKEFISEIRHYHKNIQTNQKCRFIIKCYHYYSIKKKIYFKYNLTMLN